jgi:glutamine amidotransferase
MIAIIDYGMGNLRSLVNAFDFLGKDAVVTSDLEGIEQAERIVLPGVGAFGDAMAAIRSKGLDRTLRDQALVRRKPVLGVCLGMQLFARDSSEHGMHDGLGWLDAEVRRLKVPAALKVPHVGWNEVHFPPDDWLFRGIRATEANFYFVHSYEMLCRNPSDLLATTDYGKPVTAVVRSNNLVAAQFHPEKSQDNGLAFLQNWCSWSPRC